MRSGSVRVQICPRKLLNPVGLFSSKGELANRAVVSGANPEASRTFLAQSNSLEKSKLACTLQVPFIMYAAKSPR